MTHSYVILRISSAAYAEIREQLRIAGYENHFRERDSGEVIDMYGIGLQVDNEPCPFCNGSGFAGGSTEICCPCCRTITNYSDKAQEADFYEDTKGGFE